MTIDTHQNQDKVFKEALDLFLNKSLDFFGIEDMLTDILSTEIRNCRLIKFTIRSHET